MNINIIFLDCTSMQCSNCGGENDNDSQFCVHCGCKTTVTQTPPISIDSEKPVESWETTVSVGSGCSLIVGMVIGYLGFNYGAPAAIICFIFIVNNSTSRPWYRKATIMAMMIIFGSLLGIIVQKILLISK
jgi:DnaJ-class molecular chaperone